VWVACSRNGSLRTVESMPYMVGVNITNLTLLNSSAADFHEGHPQKSLNTCRKRERIYIRSEECLEEAAEMVRLLM